jgi:hypothetical protein
MATRKPQQKTDELIPQVLALRNEGLKLHQIAARFNLTKQRIDQILREYGRREAIMAEWGYPFTVRCLGFIEAIGIRNRDEALDLFKKGHIRPGCVANFGVKTYHEICDWLGVEPQYQLNICPHCGKTLSSARC